MNLSPAATGLALWLLPAEKDEAVLQRLAAGLAERFGVVSFLPHLTLHSGPFPAKGTPEVPELSSPLELEVTRIDASSLFTESLVLRFPEDARLTALAEAYRSRIGDASAYELRPHLSLLYANLSLAEKRELARELSASGELPGRVRFDRLCLVEHPEGVERPEDVARFRTLATE